MTRTLALLLTLSMLFVLTACGGNYESTLINESAEATTSTTGSTNNPTDGIGLSTQSTTNITAGRDSTNTSELPTTLPPTTTSPATTTKKPTTTTKKPTTTVKTLSPVQNYVWGCHKWDKNSGNHRINAYRLDFKKLFWDWGRGSSTVGHPWFPNEEDLQQEYNQHPESFYKADGVLYYLETGVGGDILSFEEKANTVTFKCEYGEITLLRIDESTMKVTSNNAPVFIESNYFEVGDVFKAITE